MRAQAHAINRRGARYAAAARKETRRWIGHQSPKAYHTTTWQRVAQAVGSALLCGALAVLTAFAGMW